MREQVIWTDLTPREIGEALMEKDLYVSERVIRQLLEDAGYRRRQIQKYLDMGSHEDRNAQFENIARIKQDYLDSTGPDPEHRYQEAGVIGDFYRDGRVYTRQGLLAFDHDFPSYADGVVIPYGLYDLKRNSGYLSVGTSHDTTEFACDSIAWWWENYGRSLYPDAHSILPVVRWRRQQQRRQVSVQGGPAEAGRSAGTGDPHGALPALLLEIQPDRASVVPARDAEPARG